MEQNLSNALSILAVGMVTVIIILALVVVIGNFLIQVTNKFWPQTEILSKKNGSSPSISAGTLAAIVAAVDAFTRGKGKITKIEINKSE